VDTKPRKITDAEMAVMRVLWERQPMTARAITEAIYPDCSESDFASVHTFLQRLERKGLVRRDRSSFVHLFSAAASRTEVAGEQLEALADRLSDGSLAPFIAHLVRRRRLSEKELAEIRRLFDEVSE